MALEVASGMNAVQRVRRAGRIGLQALYVLQLVQRTRNSQAKQLYVATCLIASSARIYWAVGLKST